MYCRTYQGIFRVAVNFLNWKEPELVKGAGSVKKLPEVVKANGHNSVLVVTDKGLMGLHLLDGLFEGLEAGNYCLRVSVSEDNEDYGGISEFNFRIVD